MSKPLVLVTGGTGHVGFATLALALKQGYRARVSSRNLATAERLRDLPSIKPYLDSVSFIEVPDVLAENAYDEAVKNVDYVLHIAAPVPDLSQAAHTVNVEEKYIQPAVQGNIAILEAARKSPSVKRIVITSSVAILSPQPGNSSVGPDDLAPLPSITDIPPNPWVAYGASKIIANAAVQDFAGQHDLHFDIVHVLPAWVHGRNEPVRSAQGLIDRVSSNGAMLNYVLGGKETEPRPTSQVFLDDVAATHVAALQADNVHSGERFIAAYPTPIHWGDIDAIVRRLFPDQVQRGVLPLGGEQPGRGSRYDSSKTTARLGVEFHGLEDMVKSLIGQYVELVDEAKTRL